MKKFLGVKNGKFSFRNWIRGAWGFGDLHLEVSNKQNQQPRSENARDRKQGNPDRNAFRIVNFLCFVVIVCSLVSCVSTLTGCTAAQKQRFKDGFIDVASCSLYASIGCVAQSMGGCAAPLDTFGNSEWKEYASCLSSYSASCSAKGIGLCTYRSIVDSLDGAPFVGGGVGVGCAHSEALRACVEDRSTEIQTEADAVEIVAECQREICR